MKLAILKFVDMSFRSLFLLLPLFFLSAAESGQLGLIVTAVVFYSFICGFERYLDLQRCLVGKSELEFEKDVLSAIRFYSFNQIILLPIFISALYLLINLTSVQILLIIVIVIAEQLSNEIYRMSLVLPSFRPWFSLVVTKNFALFCVAILTAISNIKFVSLNFVLIAWFIISLFFICVSAWKYYKRIQLLELDKLPDCLKDIKNQYKRSSTHFWIGLSAWLSVQGDRFIVGAVLPLEDVGNYYRHVVLAAAAYQAVSIVSHNRILLSIYETIREKHLERLQKILIVERFVLITLGGLVIFIINLIDITKYSEVNFLKSFMPSLLMGLCLAFLVRALADYNTLILNGAHRERDIFISQVVSLIFSMSTNLILTFFYGLSGTVISVVLGASIYLLITSIYVKKRSIISKFKFRETI